MLTVRDVINGRINVTKDKRVRGIRVNIVQLNQSYFRINGFGNIIQAHGIISNCKCSVRTIHSYCTGILHKTLFNGIDL